MSKKAPGKSLKSRVLKGTAWTSVSFVLTFAAQFLQYVLLARFLGPSELGQIAVVTILNGFADIILGMGIAQAIIQRKKVASKELASLYWLNIALGLILTISTFLVSGPVALFLNAPDAQILIQIVSPVFLILSMGQVHRAVLEKRLHFSKIALTESVASLAMLSATFIFLTFGYGALSAVFGLLSSAVIRTSLVTYLGRRHFRTRLRFRASETTRFLSFGIYQTLDSLVTYGTTVLGTVSTGRFVGASAMGGYNLAFNTAVNLPARVNPVLTRVLFPAFSLIQDDIGRLRSSYLKLITATSLISMPLLTCLALTANTFVMSVYGESWEWISPLITVLAAVGALRSLGNPIGILLQATDNMKISLVMNICKLLISLPLVIAGSVIWGVFGAAYGLLIAQVLGFFLTYTVVRMVLGTPLVPYLKASFAIIPMSMAMGLAAFCVDRWLDVFGVLPVLQLTLSAVAALAILAIGFSITRNQTLKEFRAMVLHRRS